MKIHTIHGIHRKRAGWLVTLATGLRTAGHDAQPFVYGYTFAITAYLVSWFAARALARITQDGDAWFVHSNGDRVAHWAMHKHGAKPALIVKMSGAMNRSAEPPPGLDCQVWVLSTPHDEVLGKIRWLPGPWGDQGAVGYKPKKGRPYDPRIRNLVCRGIACHTCWGGSMPWLIQFANQAISLIGKPAWWLVPVVNSEAVNGNG